MMERTLLNFLGGRGRAKIENVELRLISAAALLQARKEAQELAEEDQEALGLCLNACILAQAAYREDGERMFRDGMDVMQRISAERIGRWTKRYLELCAEENPVCSMENRKTFGALLEKAPYERIKWRVLRAFGVLPSEKRAQEMTDGDYLYCVMQMALDEEEERKCLCPQCREETERNVCVCCGAALPEENENFDEARFEELRQSGIS